MKNFEPKSFFIGFAVGFLFLFLITILIRNPFSQVSSDVSQVVNYDSLCIVGKNYTLYPFDYNSNKNPFEKPGTAYVTITQKKEGFVQYCYAYEVGHPLMYFNKSCKEFIEATKEPK